VAARADGSFEPQTGSGPSGANVPDDGARVADARAVNGVPSTEVDPTMGADAEGERGSRRGRRRGRRGRRGGRGRDAGVAGNAGSAGDVAGDFADEAGAEVDLGPDEGPGALELTPSDSGETGMLGDRPPPPSAGISWSGLAATQAPATASPPPAGTAAWSSAAEPTPRSSAEAAAPSAAPEVAEPADTDAAQPAPPTDPAATEDHRVVFRSDDYGRAPGESRVIWSSGPPGSRRD
jgi:ribonuclease E